MVSCKSRAGKTTGSPKHCQGKNRMGGEICFQLQKHPQNKKLPKTVFCMPELGSMPQDQKTGGRLAPWQPFLPGSFSAGRNQQPDQLGDD